MRFDPAAFFIRCVLMLSVGLIGLNLVAIAARFPTVLGGIAVLLFYRRLRLRRWRGGGDAYGSARASSIGELSRAGMLGDDGLILGTCGYMGRPTRWQGLRALFSTMPAPLACRLFLAAFFGKQWMDR